MLIEFSVKNFMCFKNEVTFSFEAMKDLPETEFFNPQSRRDLGVEGVDPINVVNGIYGENAAGKTTLLRAMNTLFRLIMTSAKYNEEDDFGVDYCDDTKPMSFKIKFLQKEKLYSYFITISGEKQNACVEKEELTNITKNRVLLSRNANKITLNALSTKKDLNKARTELLQEDLQKNQLVFSYSFNELKNLRETFSKEKNPFVFSLPLSFQSITEIYSLPFELSSIPLIAFAKRFQARLLEEETKTFLLEELRRADLNIIDFNFDEEDILYFTDKKGKKRFLPEQSGGTRTYFYLLLKFKLDIQETGGMLIVDELEKSLHPRLALRFINLFKNPETNPNNARLLFSSHDLGFMHHGVLNGDQVWFIGRDDDTEETEIWSPAQDENFDPLRLRADYMKGLYGFVPKTEWRF